MNYKFTVPPTADQGSYSGTCRNGYGQTYRAMALQAYNSCRAHDGLPPLTRMPSGTVYTPIVEFVLQGNYRHGWDDLCSEATRREAVAQMKCYRENEGGTYRIVRRAVK